MHTFELTQRSYAFEVTVDEFMAISDRDMNEEKFEDTLCAKLDKTEGVRDVDYDGHFGPYIYFSISNDADSDKLRDEIKRMILDYANGKELA